MLQNVSMHYHGVKTSPFLNKPILAGLSLILLTGLKLASLENTSKTDFKLKTFRVTLISLQTSVQL